MLYKKYMALDCEVQGHIHAGLRSAPLNNKRYVRWHAQKLRELQNARDKAREAWREESKKHTQPSRKEKMIAAANGHEDLSSTQAARGVCQKYGWNWEGKKIFGPSGL